MFACDKWKDRSADGPASAKKPRKVKERQKEEKERREKEGGQADGKKSGSDGEKIEHEVKQEF